MTDIRETGPDELASTNSLGRLIAEAGQRSMHILFVHGIRAGDRGTSNVFRDHMSRRIAGAALRSTTLNHRLELGANPGVTYMGEPVWPTQAIWRRAAPTSTDTSLAARRAAPSS